MKNIILLVLVGFFVVGCAPKGKVTTSPKQEVKETVYTQPQEVYEDAIEKEPVVADKKGANKIAVLYPSKIVGKYAKSTVNAVMAYLIYNNKEFEIEAFDSYDESNINILTQIKKIEEQGFKKVITLFTQNGYEILNRTHALHFAKVYFPLINKSEVSFAKDNFVFGGISYERQVKLLKTLSSEKSTMFYVPSYLGNKLKDLYNNEFIDTEPITKEIQRTNNKYQYIMNDERIAYNTVLLNTPIIKTSIILSQLTAYEIDPIRVLSTQLNYNPLLVKLTQPRDRTNLFVVNSIGKVDSFIEEYADLLGADIIYNWVDYSSLVGAEYLMNLDTDENKKIIETEIEDNQVKYEPILFRGTSYGFKEVTDIDAALEETYNTLIQKQEEKKAKAEQELLKKQQLEN
ncbi:hypothetical protein [Halarcobacter sp.]|uniref:hypothetical protein n=1 Tax=Halarcobacter sp. TaxID=2321133 RepID=UPI003A9530B6